MTRARLEPVLTRAVDNYLANVDTLLTAIAQRPLTPDQLDRFAALLQRGEQDALRRLRKRRKVA